MSTASMRVFGCIISSISIIVASISCSSTDGNTNNSGRVYNPTETPSSIDLYTSTGAVPPSRSCLLSHRLVHKILGDGYTKDKKGSHYPKGGYPPPATTYCVWKKGIYKNKHNDSKRGIIATNTETYTSYRKDHSPFEKVKGEYSYSTSYKDCHQININSDASCWYSDQDSIDIKIRKGYVYVSVHFIGVNLPYLKKERLPEVARLIGKEVIKKIESLLN